MKTKNNFVLTTPVLFIVFNRLDTTKQVFEEIKKAKPQKIFIAADGPRNKEEKKKTDAIRNYILKNINWKCELKTLFREKNLGCKYAVAGAIDWFFENVEQGIILEDDCLPSQSFFIFCQDMLERYKTDQRIMHISGTNVESKNKMLKRCDLNFPLENNVFVMNTSSYQKSSNRFFRQGFLRRQLKKYGKI